MVCQTEGVNRIEFGDGSSLNRGDINAWRTGRLLPWRTA